MGDRTILLVDDSRVARMLTRHSVDKLGAGWTVLEAGSGEEALALAAGQPIGYALVDMNMPGIDGLSTARRLAELCPGIRISLLTANIQDPVRAHAEEQGIGFLTKPLRDDLLAGFLADKPAGRR